MSNNNQLPNLIQPSKKELQELDGISKKLNIFLKINQNIGDNGYYAITLTQISQSLTKCLSEFEKDITNSLNQLSAISKKLADFLKVNQNIGSYHHLQLTQISNSLNKCLNCLSLSQSTSTPKSSGSYPEER